MRKHKRQTHEKNKPRPYSCELCHFTSAGRQSLVTHIRSVHEGLKPFACDLCNFTSGRKAGLKKHIDVVHKKIKNFACDRCEFITGLKGELFLTKTFSSFYVSCKYIRPYSKKKFT